jgi:hypothetical protein
LIFFIFHGGGATITNLAGGVHNYFQLFIDARRRAWQDGAADWIGRE